MVHLLPAYDPAARGRRDLRGGLRRRQLTAATGPARPDSGATVGAADARPPSSSPPSGRPSSRVPLRASPQAGDPIMPLSELRAGMQCTAYSVIRGTEISAFDVEIVDVVSGDASANDGPRILVRLSGEAVDRTGVGPGFSGSPIYCDGRNAGAISESIGEYGGKTVLATPIEEILANPPDAPRGKPIVARSVTRIGRVLPLAAPLTVSGLDRGLAAALTAAGAKAAPPGPRRPRDAAHPVPREPAASRLGDERRLLLRRPRRRRGRHRRVRRRRPRVGLRPPVRELRPARAAAPGRLRLHGHLEPQRRRRHRLDLQARRRRARPRDDLQRRHRGRRRPLRRDPAHHPGARLQRRRGHRRALRRSARGSSTRPTPARRPAAPRSASSGRSRSPRAPRRSCAAPPAS